MTLEVLWHDLECSAYDEDLPLWRELAGEAGGPVLDVGAGTGRVSLDLATHGIAVVALDADAPLLEALERRAAGLPIETVVADARDFDLGRRFPLVLVPMQTLQLLGGRSGRAKFLRRALDHLQPGGLLAVAVADAMDCFDEEHAMPPPPGACEVADVRYASHLVSVVEEDGRAAIHRRREIIGPGTAYESVEAVVRLDRVAAGEVAAEAAELGFLTEPDRFVPETEEYLGSTVVVLRKPMVVPRRAYHRAMTSVGPVQFIAVGFPEDATYEGRILAQIEKIEVSGSLRVLDVLFVRKDPETGELQTIDVQSEELQALAGTRTLGVSRREIEGVGDELAPGQAAGMILVEHVWARDLAEAIESTGGGVLAQGLLGPDAIEEIVTDLASTD